MFKTIFLFVLALLNLSTVLGESTNFTEKTIEHCILNYTKEENSEIFYFSKLVKKDIFLSLTTKYVFHVTTQNMAKLVVLEIVMPLIS